MAVNHALFLVMIDVWSKQEHTLSCMYLGIFFWNFLGIFLGEFLYFKDMFVLTSAMQCDGYLIPCMISCQRCLVSSEAYAYLYLC